jgi:hypothetical protein
MSDLIETQAEQSEGEISDDGLFVSICRVYFHNFTESSSGKSSTNEPVKKKSRKAIHSSSDEDDDEALGVFC